MEENYKLGYVQSIEDDMVYCILKKDYELDHELEFHMMHLNSNQIDILSIGSILRYNMESGNIQFNFYQRWI